MSRPPMLFGQIMGLDPNSTATLAGLYAGDLLISVGTATTMDEYNKIIPRSWGRSLTVSLTRGSGKSAQWVQLQWTPMLRGNIGFTLLPVSFPSGSFKSSDVKKVQIPKQTKHLISNTYGRPRAPPIASKWVGHGFPTYDEADLPYTLKIVYESQKLENVKGVCYRNAVMQLLLNCSPTLAIFLSEHKNISCNVPDCLTHALGRLYAAYTGEVTAGGQEQNNYLAQGAFYDVCDKLFWGERAAAKHKIDVSIGYGGAADSFLLHLLAQIKDQLRVLPEQMQAFERLFQIEIRTSAKCFEDHIGGYENYNVFDLILSHR